MSLVAEALDLPSDAFDPFYKPGKDRMQHRGKVRISNPTHMPYRRAPFLTGCSLVCEPVDADHIELPFSL